ILRLAVRCNAIPVTLNHLGKLLVGLETLPFERITPVVKEPSGPALRLVVPKLPKGLLEHVGRVESLVGFKQHPQAAPSFVGEILSVRQERILLSLDEASIFTCQPAVLAFSHFVQGFTQMTQDMELVEKNRGWERVL